MSEHTPEPWTFNSNTGSIGILSNEDNQSFGIITQVIAYIDRFDTNEWEANARRIVACVNACTGMDDPAKEIAALRAQVEEWELIKKAFVKEYNAKNKGWNRNPLDYHSHSHDVAGIWDSDNGVLAGKKCAACMAMRAALATTGKENV